MSHSQKNINMICIEMLTCLTPSYYEFKDKSHDDPRHGLFGP